MKKILLLVLVAFSITINAHEKLSIVERFTNASCPPCASINNAWYNSTTQDLINSEAVSHIIYNVWWPGSDDPMYIFNQSENIARTNYYSVNAVPTIIVNGTVTDADETIFGNTVDAGNQQYSPFKIDITPGYYSSNRLRVKVKIHRDANDTTTPENLNLRLAVTEKQITYLAPPGSNGESEFYSVCRKILPDADGESFELPAVGDSVEFNYEFVTSDEFVSTVDVQNLRIVGFIQNSSTKEIYQSVMEDAVYIKQLEALFATNELVGISPLTVTFNNFSTSTDSTSITSWEWDFDNDGVVDSEEQEPTYTFNEVNSYSVSLTVKDGIETFTTVKENYINVVSNTSDILIVNGIDYSENQTEMETFYNSSVCFGGNDVDVWDSFGDQEFNYSLNSKIKQTLLFNQYIPQDVLNLYDKVVLIEETMLTDNDPEIGDQIIEYIKNGGNVLVATSNYKSILNDNLISYCGISRFSPNSLISGFSSVHPNLNDLSVSNTNTNIQYARLDDSSKAIPLYTRTGSPDWVAGFTVHKDGNGAFIYLGGSPYLFDNTTATETFDYIITNWMEPNAIVGINDDIKISNVTEFKLYQNYPNPFNPSTTIKYEIPNSVKGKVTLKVFDVLGREVQTLLNENKEAGFYEINYDASELHSGVYYYQIKAGDYSETKKMLLLK